MLVAERKQGLTAELLDPLRSGLVWLGRPPRLAEARGLRPSEILLGRRYRRTRHAAASRRGRPAAADDVKGGYPLLSTSNLYRTRGLHEAPGHAA